VVYSVEHQIYDEEIEGSTPSQDHCAVNLGKFHPLQLN